MTFPSKKRINTELFIDRNRGFIYKNGWGNVLEKLKRVKYIGGKQKCGNENRKWQPVRNGLL